jgi:sodium/bile acid cotransporter 7
VPCTLASAILWTRLANGNEATAILAVTGTILISWFATPLLVARLTEVTLDADVLAEMMFDLILSLIVPMFLGQGLRLIPPGAAFADRHKIALSALSQGLVLAIILKAGVTVGDKIHSDEALRAPVIFLVSVALAVFLHLAALAAGSVSSRCFGFDRGRQIAVAFSASQKTLQVSLLIYDQYFRDNYPFAVVPLLFYHVGQLMLDTVIAKRMIKRTRHVEAAEAVQAAS